MDEVLEARDRRQGGVTAPPQGLYLTGVRYAAALAAAQRGWRNLSGPACPVRRDQV